MFQVENVTNFLISHQRWFDGPALKLLLAQVPIYRHFLLIIHCQLKLNLYKGACLLIAIFQLVIMDVFLGYR